MDEQRPLPTTIAGVPLELVVPTSHAERWELTLAMSDADGHTDRISRVLAAALGLCWTKLRQYLAKDRIRYRGDIIEYGGAVVDYLCSHDRKIPARYDQIVAAGRAA